MRIAGAVALAICAMLAFLVLSNPTTAAPSCGAACPSVSVSSRAPAPGAQLTVQGSGFRASHPIRIELRSTHAALATVRTNAAGWFQAAVTLPRGLSGSDAVIATDARTGARALRWLDVGGADPTSSGGYAGVALIGLAAIGLVLLAGSTLLVFAGRQQRATV